MKRLKRLEVRLSGDELSIIAKRAGSMRLGTWMRTQALDRIPPQIPSVNVSALAELGRIGNNLNQIARVANSHSRIELAELQQQIGQLRIALMEARS